MASRDWHRAAVEAERQRDNAIAQLEYEQANRRRNDAEIAHERDDFIKELETANNGMRAALVATQELHRPVPIYTTESGDCEHGDECEGIETHHGDMYCPDQTDGVTCAECGGIAMNFSVDDGFPEWPCATRKLADAGLAGGWGT